MINWSSYLLLQRTSRARCGLSSHSSTGWTVGRMCVWSNETSLNNEGWSNYIQLYVALDVICFYLTLAFKTLWKVFLRIHPTLSQYRKLWSIIRKCSRMYDQKKSQYRTFSLSYMQENPWENYLAVFIIGRGTAHALKYLSNTAVGNKSCNPLVSRATANCYHFILLFSLHTVKSFIHLKIINFARKIQSSFLVYCTINFSQE